jgi:hypothetical protein
MSIYRRLNKFVKSGSALGTFPSDWERDPGQVFSLAPKPLGILRVLRSGWDWDSFWISLKFEQSIGTIIFTRNCLRSYGCKERGKSAVERILREKRFQDPSNNSKWRDAISRPTGL